jgi:mRNA interferase RelE/StbE
MPSYSVTFARSVRKELQSLPIAVAARILKKVEALGINPRPVGSKKLIGAKDFWRLRVGDYRVVYKIDDEKGGVDVSVVRHRSEAYR